MKHWLHHLFNPHCDFCRDIEAETKVCLACEVLKNELAIAHATNHQLIEHITTPAKIEVERTEAPVPVTVPKYIPFSVRRQMLEAEDRERARLMREAPIPDPGSGPVDRMLEIKSTTEIEKELGLDLDGGKVIS